MTYQIGLILILVAIAILISKKFNKKDNDSETYIYEDEMNSDELEELDKEID